MTKYQAPIDFTNPEAEIKYDYMTHNNVPNPDDESPWEVMVDDQELEWDYAENFCAKICTKICYYIQKMYSFDILKMKARFLKDDNGKIWLIDT